MNKRNAIIVLLIAMIIPLVASITYALFIWQSSNTSIIGKSGCFDILYVKGQDIGSDQEIATLFPSVTYTGGLSSTFKFNLSSKCSKVTAKGMLYIETLDTTSENLYEEGLLNYQLLVNGEVTDIKGSITSSEEIVLDLGLLNKATTATNTYTLYVWVDYNLVQNSHAFSNYYGKIRAEAIQIGVQ